MVQEKEGLVVWGIEGLVREGLLAVQEKGSLLAVREKESLAVQEKECLAVRKGPAAVVGEKPVAGKAIDLLIKVKMQRRGQRSLGLDKYLMVIAFDSAHTLRCMHTCTHTLTCTPTPTRTHTHTYTNLLYERLVLLKACGGSLNG